MPCSGCSVLHGVNPNFKKTTAITECFMRNYPTHVDTEKDNKNHTNVKKVGAHPRISLLHFFMNLKNNYLLKKLLKWANKKCKYFNIYKNKKKIKEKHLEISLFYACVTTVFMI